MGELVTISPLGHWDHAFGEIFVNLHFPLLATLEKIMATHSSILAWKIPWAEEPGGLQSMGSQRVGQFFFCGGNYSDLVS